MWVKATQTLMGNYGRKEAGDKFNVKQSYGEQLIKQGLAEEVEGSEEETVSESTIQKEPSFLFDKTNNESEPEEAGTKPNPLTPDDVLEIKEEKEEESTKEEKGIKKTK